VTDGQELGHTRELHAWTERRRSELALMGIDSGPVRARHEPGLTVAQPGGGDLRRGALAVRVADVGQQLLDGCLRALLVGADDAARTALDPARDVARRQRLGCPSGAPRACDLLEAAEDAAGTCPEQAFALIAE
jgi:hypothetical protein